MPPIRMTTVGRTLAVVLLLVVGACASPDPVLFTLAAMPGEVLHTRPGAVELRRISLARYLDRSGIVRNTTPYRITVTDGQRWAEPLSRMLERVLAENLASRLPDRIVYTDSSGITQRSPIVLDIDVQRFDPDPSGDVVLAVQASVAPDGRNAATSGFRILRHPASASTEDLVAAMSAALSELSDRLALLLSRP